MEGDSPEFSDKSLETESNQSLDAPLVFFQFKDASNIELLSPLLQVLQSKGEPIRLGDKIIPTKYHPEPAQLIGYTSKERREEIESLIRLLTLSPQHMLLRAVMNAGGPLKECTKLVNDVLMGNDELSDREKALFDPNCSVPSTHQMLFPPFEISKELKSHLRKAVLKYNSKNHTDWGAFFKAVADSNKETHFATGRRVKSGIKNMFEKLSSSKEPIGDDLMQGMYAQAYESLMETMGGDRSFLREHVLSGSLDFIGKFVFEDDYMNPSLLVHEELGQRGFDDIVYRAISFGDVKKSQDGLEDRATAIVDEKARAELKKVEFDPSMVRLERAYKGQLSWKDLVSVKREDGSYAFPFLRDEVKDDEENVDKKEKDTWKDTIFTEEEKKQLVVWSMQNFRQYYEHRHPGFDNLAKVIVDGLEKDAEVAGKLNVKPIDQPDLRRMVKKIVDRCQNKEAADINA